MMILVRNFAEFVTEEGLKVRFLKYGEISSACIVLDKTIDEPRKLGFVDMPNEAQALAAIKALHRSKFQKEIIRVTKANPRFGPDYYLGNTKPPVPMPTDKPAAPVRPAYESFAQKAKPDFKFGAKRRQHTDKRDVANSQFQRNTNRPEYPRGGRPYSSNTSADGKRTYGHFQKRDGARPYSAPQGVHNYGYPGSKDRGARPPQRESGRPEYKPRSERPYNRNTSNDSNRPFGYFQKRDGARPYSAPQGGHSRVYQGSKDRSERPPQSAGARQEYKPRSERPYSRKSFGSSSKPHGNFHKRDGGKSGPAQYGKRIHSK